MPFYSITTGGGLVEAASFAALPATGAAETLYVVAASNTLYRWNGIAYVEVSASPAEVVEAANLAALPATGAAGKIYVALDTGKTYRWSGSAYAEISAGDWATITNKPTTFAPSSHVHGSLTNDGKIGTASGKVITTTTGGAVAAVDAIPQTAVQSSVGGYASLAAEQAAVFGTIGTLGSAAFVDIATSASNATAAQAVRGDDPRMTNARTPTSHTHAAGDIASGTIATARLATGTASAANYLRGDQTWAAIATYTLPAATTSVLGGVIVGTGINVTGGTASVAYGTAAGTACQGNDSRLSDARAPLTHTHAASDIASGTIATARLATGTASASTYLRGDQTWAAVATYTLPAATTSALGGIIVGSGLSVSAGTVSANVLSVAGQTGAVTLTHSNVGNAPATLAAFTAAQNNLAIGTGGIVRISSTAAVNITGFVATSAGDARLLSNVGAFAITLKHADAASTAANRLLCVGNADVEIAAGGSAVIYYDGTDSRWRVG